MKKIKLLFTTLLFVGLAFNSCDVVEGPYMEDIVVEECTSKCRKVLLEEYTGHKCGNCPRAAEKAEELLDIYGDQLVSISIHAGFFANTYPGNYENDYTTPTGDAWDTHFGNSNAGNPNGMINRRGYNDGSHILQHSQWAQNISDILSQEPEAYIDITPIYANNSLSLTARTEILKDLDVPLNLTVVLTESKIISYQTDYDAEPSSIPDYEHNHMLRASLTGTWGDDLGQVNYITGDLIAKSYNFELDTAWNVENMSIVAFISNANTFEVIQAEEVHIID